jgi:hypothetical protein
MTTAALHEILNGDNIITIEKLKYILCKIKTDCTLEITRTESRYDHGFYSGEINMIYIVLDLLDKLDSLKKLNLDQVTEHIIANIRTEAGHLYLTKPEREFIAKHLLNTCDVIEKENNDDT